MSGSNDCASDSTAEEVVDKLNSLLATADKFSTDPVTLSSICPRVDNEDFQIKAECVNATMNADSNKNYTYINNDSSFRLQDNTINDGYLHADGLHLSFRGTEKLAGNLKLGSYADIATSRKQYSHSNGRPLHRKGKKDHKQNWYSQKRAKHQSSPNSSRSSDTQDHRYCWFCGEESHSTDKCFHCKRITCRSCGRLGHKDKMCWY